MKLFTAIILASLFVFSTASFANSEAKSKLVIVKTKENTNNQYNMRKALKFLKKAKSTRVGQGKLANLLTARKALVNSASNKGGNRVAAIALIDRSLKILKKNKKSKKANHLIQKALEKTKSGIEFANKHGKKEDNKQFNMKKAIKFLKLAKSTTVGKGKIANILIARKALVNAQANKGGHRVIAISLIDKSLKKLKKNKNSKKADKLIQKAINSTKAGIKHANKK